MTSTSGAVVRGPGDELRGGLEQARPFQLGRRRRRVAAGSRPKRAGKLGGEAAEVVGPGRLGRRGWDLAAELGRQLRPQAQGRAAAELEPGADGAAGAAGRGRGRAARWPGGSCRCRPRRAGRRRHRSQRGPRPTRAGAFAARPRGRRAEAGGGSERALPSLRPRWPRPRPLRFARLPPQRFGQLARRGARRQAQLAAQPLAQALVGGQSARGGRRSRRSRRMRRRCTSSPIGSSATWRRV